MLIIPPSPSNCHCMTHPSVNTTTLHTHPPKASSPHQPLRDPIKPQFSPNPTEARAHLLSPPPPHHHSPKKAPAARARPRALRRDVLASNWPSPTISQLRANSIGTCSRGGAREKDAAGRNRLRFKLRFDMTAAHPRAQLRAARNCRSRRGARGANFTGGPGDIDARARIYARQRLTPAAEISRLLGRERGAPISAVALYGRGRGIAAGPRSMCQAAFEWLVLD